MANYSGSRTNALLNSLTVNMSKEERNKAFENATEFVSKGKSLKKISLKNPSEHNHSK